MDPRFLIHNSHIEDPKHFATLDPHLRQLNRLPYVHVPLLLNKLPYELPGIYTLGGGRQIGKTTLLKQWMVKLLASGVVPQAITFLTGEFIDDHHALFQQIEQSLQKERCYLIIDEVTYIRGWEKAIKFAADAGLFQNTIVMLSGSDLALMQEARMTFPGRRGQASEVDFHVYPLSYGEFLSLCRSDLLSQAQASSLESSLQVGLMHSFEQYLTHGGFLTGINDWAMYQRIMPATLQTYSDWIRGDLLKRGKHERYLKEILQAILKRYGSQVSWNALAHDLSIDHPKTVADYCLLLETMDALFLLSAILEDKLMAAPKKPKKIFFTDPFIYHAIKAWLSQGTIEATLSDPMLKAALVETSVVNHFRRFYPTFYIKAEGEVDIAYVSQGKFWPIEIKWTEQLRSPDLKQVRKYANGEIWAKTCPTDSLYGIPVKYLPQALLQMEAQAKTLI